jgi:hypothetical protein
MLKEIQESVSHNISERLSSPILGSFIIFFTAFHWRFIVCLFFHDSNGIQLLSELDKYKPHGFSSYFYPALFSLIYSLGYPFIKMAYSLFVEWIKYLHAIQELRSDHRGQRLEEEKLVRTQNHNNLMAFYKIENEQFKHNIETGNIDDSTRQYFGTKFGELRTKFKLTD